MGRAIYLPYLIRYLLWVYIFQALLGKMRIHECNHIQQGIWTSANFHVIKSLFGLHHQNQCQISKEEWGGMGRPEWSSFMSCSQGRWLGIRTSKHKFLASSKNKEKFRSEQKTHVLFKQVCSSFSEKLQTWFYIRYELLSSKMKQNSSAGVGLQKIQNLSVPYLQNFN